MAFDVREKTGFLFINDRKREGRQDPDHQGTIKIDGRTYWINAWEKSGQKGDFLSLSIREQAENGHHKEPRQINGHKDFHDDEIPF